MTDAPAPDGLPEALPRGERILWRGRPDPLALMFAAFRIGWVAAYFAVLFVWRGAGRLSAGAGWLDALGYAAFILPIAAAAIGILALLGWLAARTTLYTVTDRRLVLRIGTALPMTVNLPFDVVAGAAVKPRGRGCGDIAFALKPEARVSYLALWPHVRSWRFARPEPSLRAVPEVDALALRLAETLRRTERQTTGPAARPARDGMPAGIAVAAE
ncbi:hypothetical protein C2U72_23595 [Prosthecomicrobium hirschii]|uniref:photosynthetic complex putative assembly protein PuhB n=1 Tax=Prosthecodimorpha hirschii TaxID=665126 RepID=UPI001128CA21|nr:photosynthetic complex putative assembly protein PuhB [Prosthecomicrobium hirschii]TPQ48058.1 hypothetical protein C2U72_23595 [Prosthecomicrobium hirschii]